MTGKQGYDVKIPLNTVLQEEKKKSEGSMQSKT